ncbi:hypothetical protein J3R82DRAFT_1204 [Butyriboletus roseoflavus]|nr:hypothetical protein J3R82DRAFT_1204 [Butyriboletus roseoflavus]
MWCVCFYRYNSVSLSFPCQVYPLVLAVASPAPSHCPTVLFGPLLAHLSSPRETMVSIDSYHYLEAPHSRDCSFYCIILLAALFLSSCYWQSFPLDAHLAIPWADNITTFSEALNATIPAHLKILDPTPPIVRVADRCWCDFASGLFEPYDVQKWERDSIQKAITQIEKQRKQFLEPDSDISANVTTTTEPSQLEFKQTSITPTVLGIRNETLSSIFRSLFSRRSYKLGPSPTSTPTDATTLPEVLPKSSAVEPSIPAEPLLVPGQLDMRPFGFELIFDFRWSKRF